MKKKALAFAAAACSLALFMGACGGSSSNNASGSSNGGIITAWGGEPQNPLIPGDTNETSGGKVLSVLFSALVAFDAEGKAHNEVAESITPNEDASEYTIKIKDGWKFTDGTPVTAESFTKSWSYTSNVKNAQNNSSFFSTIEGYDALQDASNLKGDEQLSGLKVVDDHTFTVKLSQPDATFPIKVGYTAFSPLPEAFFKDTKAFGEAPIGNGPYKFDHWNHNAEIAVVKNPDYKGIKEVKNDGITFVVYTDTEAGYSAVQGGQLDVMEGVPSSARRTFEKDDLVQPYNQAGSVIQSFTIHTNLDHFKMDEEGKLRRRAISMAIDRQAIIDKVLGGIGTAPTDFTSPLVPGYSKDLKGGDVLKYNPEEAKKLWEQADAISKYDGGLTFSYNADGGAKDLYDAIVNGLNNVLPIKAQTNPIPTFQEFRSAVADRKMTGAFRTGWQPDYPSAENYLFQLFASKAADGNGSNDADYKNPEFDKLIDEAYRAQSTDDANKLYQQAEEILLQDLPSIPLYYGNAIGVAAKNIKGFKLNWQTQPIYNELTKG